MENSNQAQLSTQGYNHQLQQAMWSGSKICQNAAQSTNIDSYSQQMNRFYQAPYQPQPNDINRFNSGISKDQISNSSAYSSQYPLTRQNNYSCPPPSQNYQAALKNSCNSNIYYNNVNSSKNCSSNSILHMPKKYGNPSLGLPQASSALPQNSQVSRSATPMPQMPQYTYHANYPMQNIYASNYSGHANNENEQSYMLPQTPGPALSSHETSSIHSISVVPQNQVSQVSSIPTPPETSSLPTDNITPTDNTSSDGNADNMKMSMANSFALPGMISHLPNSMSSMANSAMSNRNSGNTLQPPPNLDEGSQASSASASSSIPDEQNVKTNSKPNFSYPPTPNTLSSPDAASMSSFHDDLECISSPGWPKTPASPVANSNYEFANIKRPENLLKLYTLSDEPDRRYFLDKLIVFNEDRGSPITQCPTISKQPLDVFRVYLTVKERGGFVEVTNTKRWKDIAGAIGVGASSSAAYTLRKQYMKLLLPFECKFDRGGMDPQPIINMVEASSRKKGKNSSVSGYGNQNPYNQNYPQVMERYHSGYPNSYQQPRYQCNNVMDYQCSSNSTQFPTNTPHNVNTGQNQYSQYSHGSQTNYGYYQGNNTSPGYNHGLQNNVSNNCQFGRSTTSTPVPQEQGFYSHQYSSQQGHIGPDVYNSTRGCSVETMVSPSANQTIGNHESTQYPSTNSTVDISSMKQIDRAQQPKSISDNYVNANIGVTLPGSADVAQEKVCYNNNYSASKSSSDQNSVVDKNFVSGATMTSSYQQSMAEK